MLVPAALAEGLKKGDIFAPDNPSAAIIAKPKPPQWNSIHAVEKKR